MTVPFSRLLGLATLALLPAGCGLAPRVGQNPSFALGGHQFHHRQMANGLRCFAVRDSSDDRSASVFVVIGSGTRDETADTTGLAHLTEHALYTGTARRGAGEHDRVVQEELGAESNAFTRDDYTLYYDHDIPVGSLQQVLDMEADRMANLLFDESAFLHERGRLRAEESHTHTPSAERTEQLEYAVYRQQGYRYGLRDVDGLTNAPELEVVAARDFYRRHYRPDNAAVVVVSPLDPSQVLDLIEGSFDDWVIPDLPHPRTTRLEEPEPFGMRNARFQSALSRNRVEFACTAPSWHHPDFSAIAVASRIFGRRYAQAENPFQVSFVPRNGASLFAVAATGEQAATALDEVFADLLENGPSPQEFAAAVHEEIQSHASQPLRARPYFSLAVEVGRFAVHDGVSFLLEYPDRVAALTPTTLTTAMRRWLGPGRRVVVQFTAAEGMQRPAEWPESSRALAQLAQEATDSGEYQLAVEAYQELLDRKPDRMKTVIYLATRGQLHMDHENFDLAIADFEAALEVVDYPAVRDLLNEAKRRRDD